jgi:hypothetical protein
MESPSGPSGLRRHGLGEDRLKLSQASFADSTELAVRACFPQAVSGSPEPAFLGAFSQAADTRFANRSCTESSLREVAEGDEASGSRLA